MEPPLKYGVIWNDSLLKEGKLFKIHFVTKGELSPSSTTEEIDYVFDRKGNFKDYKYFNYKFSDSVYSSVNGELNEGKLIALNTPLLFGQKQNPEIQISSTHELVTFVTINPNAKNDTVFIYIKDNSHQIIVDKIGDYISKVQFVVESNYSNSLIKAMRLKIGITDENWLNTEKIIIQTENNLPQKAFRINENYIKIDLYAEWKYEKSKKLIAYKKYIKGNCVKDFAFKYSEDKIMRSFTLNRKEYEVQYN